MIALRPTMFFALLTIMPAVLCVFLTAKEPSARRRIMQATPVRRGMIS